MKNTKNNENIETENIVYIGKNGLGKSTKLKEIYEKNKENALFIKYTEKTNAPDSNILNKNNEMLNDFQIFLNKIFNFKSKINLNDLEIKEIKQIKEMQKEIKSDNDLENLWNEMLNDKELSFLSNQQDNKQVPTFIKSNKDVEEFEINKNMYEFDFSNWKDKTKNQIPFHGTGKLVYFQIKFLYSHLELITNQKEK